MSFISTTDKRKLAAVMVVCAAIEELDQEPSPKQRKCWVTPRLQGREEEKGCYYNLLRDLSFQDPNRYRRWMRMDVATFEHLVDRLKPLIQKQDTFFRLSVPSEVRLALTLRFLATGMKIGILR